MTIGPHHSASASKAMLQEELCFVVCRLNTAAMMPLARGSTRDAALLEVAMESKHVCTMNRPPMQSFAARRWGMQLDSYQNLPAHRSRGQGYVPDIVWFVVSTPRAVVLAFRAADPFFQVRCIYVAAIRQRLGVPCVHRTVMIVGWLRSSGLSVTGVRASLCPVLPHHQWQFVFGIVYLDSLFVAGVLAGDRICSYRLCSCSIIYINRGAL